MVLIPAPTFFTIHFKPASPSSLLDKLFAGQKIAHSKSFQDSIQPVFLSNNAGEKISPCITNLYVHSNCHLFSPKYNSEVKNSILVEVILFQLNAPFV